MSAFLPSLQNLEGELNRFGANQRNDAQTAIANARANQELDLQKQAQALRDKYYQKAVEQQGFQEGQIRQQNAIRQFGSDVQVEAKVNPYLQGLLSTASNDPTGAQMASLINSNPDLKGAAQRVFQKYDRGTRSLLGPSFQALYGNGSSGIGQGNSSGQPGPQIIGTKPFMIPDASDPTNDYVQRMGIAAKVTPTATPTPQPIMGIPTPMPLQDQQSQRLNALKLLAQKRAGYKLQPADEYTLTDTEEKNPQWFAGQ